MDIKCKGIVFVMIGCLLVSGCGMNNLEETEVNNTQKNAISNDELQEYEWEINLLDLSFNDELVTTTSVRQYDGSNMEVTYETYPNDGNCYLLLKLKVQKVTSESSVFSWKNVTLIGEKNSYTRSEDVFLEDHGYERLSGIDIQMGVKEGWICFEIPQTERDSGLTLCYDYGNKQQNILIQ